ncbi:MAG: hypothetical protein AB7V06_22450, partial [Candidatus Obscuribacterales bacterium]
MISGSGPIEPSSGHYQVADAGYTGAQGADTGMHSTTAHSGGHVGGHTGGHAGGHAGSTGESYAQSAAPMDSTITPATGSPDMISGSGPIEPSSGHYQVADSGYAAGAQGADTGMQYTAHSGGHVGGDTGGHTGHAGGQAGSTGESYAQSAAPMDSTITGSGPIEPSSGHYGSGHADSQAQGPVEGYTYGVQPAEGGIAQGGLSHHAGAAEPGAHAPVSDPGYEALAREGHGAAHHEPGQGSIDDSARAEAVAREEQMRAEMEYRRNQALDAQQYHSRPPGYVPVPTPIPITGQTRQKPAAPLPAAGKKKDDPGAKARKQLKNELSETESETDETPERMDNIQPQVSALPPRKSKSDSRLRSALGRADAPPPQPEKEEVDEENAEE